MELTFSHLGTSEVETIDLDGIAAIDGLINWEGVHAYLVLALAKYVAKGNFITGLIGLTPYDIVMDSGNLDINEGNGFMQWTEDVAKLVWFLSVEKDKWHGDELYLASIYTVGWKRTDFDNLSDIVDQYYGEFDGDYEEYARQYVEDAGDDLPDHHRPYFDFASYGEALIQDFEKCEWNGKTYLFHQ